VFYSFCLRFILVRTFDLRVITLVVSLIGFSKLPVFGLHMWLPKVHVEASMIGSMVLARVVLKARTIFCNMFCLELVLLVIGVVVGRFILIGSDGKVVIAYSSVVHMSCCVISFGMLSIYRGYSHIVVSPLIFVLVYVGYLMNGSRILTSSFESSLTGGLLLFNLGFPLLGAFYCEVI
jgi:NADH:ubiquinone oxidoreductase subunit 4 (subunit M)